jgi:hypothetical protein
MLKSPLSVKLMVFEGGSFGKTYDTYTPLNA